MKIKQTQSGGKLVYFFDLCALGIQLHHTIPTSYIRPSYQQSGVLKTTTMENDESLLSFFLVVIVVFSEIHSVFFIFLELVCVFGV